MVTADYEKLKPLKVDKKVKMKARYTEKYDYELTIGKYTIIYREQGSCCNWPGILLKRKKTVEVDYDKTYDLGHVGDMKLDYGKDFVEIKSKTWPGRLNFGLLKKEPEYPYDEKILTDNVFTLSWGNGNKLLFFNGNNNGYYNYDLMIYEGDNLLFKSSL